MIQTSIRIVLTPTETDQLFPNGEHVYFWDKDKYSERPYAERLAARGLEAGISDPTDGSNLAAFLYLLRQKHLSTYSMICRTVQRVAPFFDDFVLEPLRLNQDKIRLEWRHRGADAYFDVASLSDGTLRFIALATLLLQPEEYRPSVILVDEPELGLHPYAITLLASLIKQVSHTTLVILSTQSPLLLDHFEPEDVLVAERVNGSTQFTRLDADRLAIWLEEYSLGQLGEKNELDGRPAPEGVYG